VGEGLGGSGEWRVCVCVEGGRGGQRSVSKNKIGCLLQFTVFKKSFKIIKKSPSKKCIILFSAFTSTKMGYTHTTL
jgi:hypothetical protein